MKLNILTKTVSLLLIGLCSFSYANKQQENTLIVVDGSLTEIIYALNAENQLLAIDQTSTYPAATQSLKSVGYMRALSAEGILSLRPESLITTSSAGPVETINKVKAAGVNVTVVDNQYTIQGVLDKIKVIGDLVHKPKQAQHLQEQIVSDLQPIKKLIQHTKNQDKPTVLFFLGMQGNQFMAAGKHTQAQAMLDILNAKNVAGDFHGYKPLSRESVLAANPDAIIIVSHTQSKPEALLKQFSYTSAAENNRIIIADSAKILGFGPRIPEALQILSKALYPNYKL